MRRIGSIFVLFFLFCIIVSCASTGQNKQQDNNMENRAEIVNFYRQEVPSLRFIGKKYGPGDNFGAEWGNWHRNGWFGIIQNQIEYSMDTIIDDGDAFIGLMRWKQGEPFQYWIGVFMPVGTNVPEGFQYHDFDEGSWGVVWLYGNSGNVYGQHQRSTQKLLDEGFTIKNDNYNATWYFERYVCPRFTTPDEKGNFILDMVHFIE